MIDINKKYRTKSGREVRIYSIDNEGGFPVHGAIRQSSHNNVWAVSAWTSIGTYWEDSGHADDLVEVKPKVAYLKPMFVILSECDSYSFENTGVVLRRDYGVNFIGFNELSLFSKETSTPEKYPDWFIEWREEDD